MGYFYIHLNPAENEKGYSDQDIWNPDSGPILKFPMELIKKGWIIVEEVLISKYDEAFTGRVEIIKKEDAPEVLLNGDEYKGYEKVNDYYYRFYTPALN